MPSEVTNNGVEGKSLLRLVTHQLANTTHGQTISFCLLFSIALKTVSVWFSPISCGSYTLTLAFALAHS